MIIKIQRLLVVSILLIGCVGLTRAATSEEARSVDPLVIVLGQLPGGVREGNGFVAGDGTLVVTAYHLVFGTSDKGEHAMGAIIRVLSPYLGEVREAEVVAVNERLDLAVLQVSWKGHPSFALATDKQIMQANELVVAGILIDLKALPAERMDAERQVLPVSFIGVKNGVPRIVSLGQVGELGRGWSGSPMLIPGTSRVAGCFTRIAGKGNKYMEAQGPAASQVRQLLKDAGKQESLEPGLTVLASPSDAQTASVHLLKAMSHLFSKEYQWALTEAEAFVRLRPRCPLGYRAIASAAASLGQHEQAEAMYQKALEIDPRMSATRMLYGQYLAERGQHEKALVELQAVWESGRLREVVALVMGNILYERGEFERLIAVVSEALEVNPRNAHLWVNQAATQAALKDYAGAASSYERAVKLMPERGPFRGSLAHMLEKCGKLDEAEKHFRQLLIMEPDNSVVYFWLARFLVKHHPEAKEEAIQLAEKALGLPEKRSLPGVKVEEFISKLRSQAE